MLIDGLFIQSLHNFLSFFKILQFSRNWSRIPNANPKSSDSKESRSVLSYDYHTSGLTFLLCKNSFFQISLKRRSRRFILQTDRLNSFRCISRAFLKGAKLGCLLVSVVFLGEQLATYKCILLFSRELKIIGRFGILLIFKFWIIELK